MVITLINLAPHTQLQQGQFHSVENPVSGGNRRFQELENC